MAGTWLTVIATVVRAVVVLVMEWMLEMMLMELLVMVEVVDMGVVVKVEMFVVVIVKGIEGWCEHSSKGSKSLSHTYKNPKLPGRV